MIKVIFSISLFLSALVYAKQNKCESLFAEPSPRGSIKNMGLQQAEAEARRIRLLKKSNREEDLLEYISSGLLIDQLASRSLNGTPLMDIEKLKRTLITIISSDFPSHIRVEAFLELVLIGSTNIELQTHISKNYFQLDVLEKHFNKDEITEIAESMREWSRSDDSRKSTFLAGLSRNLFNFARHKNVNQEEVDEISQWINLGFIDPNQLYFRGKTALMLAIENENVIGVHTLLSLDKTNFKLADKDGTTAIGYAFSLKNEQVKEAILQELRNRQSKGF